MIKKGALSTVAVDLVKMAPKMSKPSMECVYVNGDMSVETKLGVKVSGEPTIYLDFVRNAG